MLYFPGLLLLFSCSNHKESFFINITKTYIDSLDNQVLTKKSDTSSYGTSFLTRGEILKKQIPHRYFETLMNYFTGDIGNDEIKKFGDILIISDPYAFGQIFHFKINEKLFSFDNPPYYQLQIKSGRHIYFIDDDYNLRNSGINVYPADSLTITMHEYFYTGKDWKHEYSDKKSSVFKMIFVADSTTSKWSLLQKHKIK